MVTEVFAVVGLGVTTSSLSLNIGGLGSRATSDGTGIATAVEELAVGGNVCPGEQETSGRITIDSQIRADHETGLISCSALAPHEAKMMTGQPLSS